MPYFQSFDNQSIFFTEHKGTSKEILVFLHGWTSSQVYYQQLVKPLKEFNLYFWDARSHGKSFVDPAGTIAKMARDLDVFLTKLSGKGPITVVGHSMGALTLFEYVGQFGTKNIQRAVIVDQSPKLVTDSTWDLGIYGNYPEERNQEFIQLFLEDLGLGVIRLGTCGLNLEYNKLFLTHPEFFYDRKRTFSLEQTKAQVKIWESLTAADYRNVLSRITVPTLLLYGEKSQYYKRETALYMKEKITDSRLCFFPKGDHSPFVQEQEEFTRQIREFISEG